MFASVIANGCGLGGWLPNSQIGRATSAQADGPFELQEIIVPRFAHEPQIVTAPDGTYVIYVSCCFRCSRCSRYSCIF